ncbi:MAG: DUF3307 domain-containing protein [Cyclobacteriaceae bacterium]
MVVLLSLIVCHLLGDFCLQRYSWVIDKEENKLSSKGLYYHILIHTALLAVFVVAFPMCWIGALVILLIHFAIDSLKVCATNSSNKIGLFFLDQFLHLAVIFGVYAYYFPLPTGWLSKEIVNYSLLLINCVIFITYGASVIIQVVISKWIPEKKEGKQESLQGAGKLIGIVERLLVFGFAATANWEVIGFLLAAKSVFRFGDLREAKDRKLTEYILIGTLLSFGLAIIAGAVYTQIIKQW